MLTQNGNREILNLLLEWGKTHLLTPEFSGHLKELEDEYNSLTENVDVKELLSSLLKEISNEIDNAIDIFSNPELITAGEDDEIHIRAEESFITLDRCIYFMEAVYYLIAKDGSEKYKNILDKIDQRISDIITWLEDKDFTPLRLTAFNELRKACLAQIPDEKRFLFPWYERFSDLPETTLSAIVENYESLVSGGEVVLSEELRPYYKEIMYELKRDKAMAQVLKEEYMLHSALLGIVKEKSSINLWSIAVNMAFEHIIPEKVSKAGVVRVSREIINGARRPFINKSEKAYYLFLSAFCGPSLTNAQRLKLFDKVASLVKKIDKHDINGIPAEQANLLGQIKRWYDGEDIVLDYLGNTAFAQWERLLIETAEAIGETQIDSSPDEFWQALIDFTKVHEIPPIIVIINGKIRQWIRENVLSPYPVLCGSPLIMGEETREFKINTNPLTISIPRSPEQEYQLLPDPNNIRASENVREEYGYLWNGINPRIRGGIYAGGIILKEKATEKISVQELTDRNFYRVEGDFLKIFLGISDDMQQLEYFVKAIYENIETPQADLNLDKVLILEISLIYNI